MDEKERRLRGETEAVWATAACFVLGAAAGILFLTGGEQALTGEASLAPPSAAIAGAIAGIAFAISTVRHHRGETVPMPRWQAAVSDLSTAALTLAFGGVTAMGVLLAAEILSVGLEGLQLAAVGGGMLAGVASAVGGRFAYGAGISLRTADLAGTLFGFLVIGTLFAMLTATDPRWWERNFSALGGGTGAWAFNGTVMLAGLLVATVGSYIGRDLHRMLGDPALGRIAVVVVLWALTGAALAAVGAFPLHSRPVPHDIAAFGTLGLFVASAVSTVRIIREAPRALVLTTVGVVLLVVAAVLCWWPLGLYGATALEAMVVGLGLLWMTTLVRVLAILVPQTSRPSLRPSPLRAR